ncbi:MAG: hypothetical protein OXU79_11410 [Gemmatimonadota bacterium]|nr:hypothetical protein [Gemmatimonadota bacterium]
MIYEYALEPELVATWTERKAFRYFMSSFDFGQGRGVSWYPKHWRRLVRQSFDCTGDIAQTRLTELLNRLSEQMVRRRNYDWDSGSGHWLENAEREHERFPFHAIVARKNPQGQEHVLTEGELDSDESDRWTVSNRLVVARKATDMADAVAPLLRCSLRVIFVDPYFRPQDRRYQRAFGAFLDQIAGPRPVEAPERIEIHASTKYECSEEFFYEQCTKKLPSWVPLGMRVFVRRLRQKPGGESLHNRYILTDRGGVIFSAGLDEAKDGESATDDLALMDRYQYDNRWSQYGGDPPAGFEQEREGIELVGTRQLPSP